MIQVNSDLINQNCSSMSAAFTFKQFVMWTTQCYVLFIAIRTSMEYLSGGRPLHEAVFRVLHHKRRLASSSSWQLCFWVSGKKFIRGLGEGWGVLHVGDGLYSGRKEKQKGNISGLYKCSIKIIFGVLLWNWRRENLVKALYYHLILLILLL